MGEIIQQLAHNKYEEDLAEYTIAVNLVRALPDIRDGLKPVSRRIIYVAEHVRGATSFAKKVKSATLSGLVQGYHPHGASYPSFKTLINPFEIKMPILTGEGNFGQISGEGPAADRYTECFVSKFGMEAVIGSLADNPEVIDWVPTYTNDDIEPQYLPVKVPLLLINGILGGIGTGVKADLPTHNLREVIDATLKLMSNPNSDVVLVPDHCIPCEIIDTDWVNICNKGFGSYRARSIIETGYDNKDNPIIIIRSLPSYGTNAVVEKIDEGILSGKFPQIVKVNDETKNLDIKIVITLKKGSDVNFVKEALYKYTPCEQSFRVNFDAVNKATLVHLSYKEYLLQFIKFAESNKIREYCAKQYAAATRLHKVEAYVKIVGSPDIDKIIELIKKRTSASDIELIELLIGKYKLTDVQAEYIINSPLKSLSKGSYNRYKEEYQKLLEQDKWYENRVANESLILQDVRDDLIEIREKYGTPRICKVIQVSNLGNIPDGTFKIVVTENNYIRKLGEFDDVNTVKGDKPKFILQSVSNLENLLLFDNKGRVFKLPICKIPIISKSDPGIDIKGMIKGLTADIVSLMYEPKIISLAKLVQKVYIVTLSKHNAIKKLEIQDFTNVPPSGFIYSKLNPDDDIIDIEIVSDNLDLIIYSDSKALRVPSSTIPTYKRNTLGVSAMNTKSDLEGMSIVYPDATSVVVVTESGKINRFMTAGFERSQRNKAGNNVIKLSSGDKIHSMYGVTDKNLLQIITTSEIIEIPIKDIPIGSSISKGIKMISTKSDVIISTAIY